jgi:hypothetical protein
VIKASYTSGFKQQRANKCQINPRKENRKTRSVNKEVGENLIKSNAPPLSLFVGVVSGREKTKKREEGIY